jgi:DNA-directed RNA polymerase III subunit RPC1
MRFSMLSGNEIRQYAETQVWSNRIYGPDMKPVPNGLLDTRMVISRLLILPSPLTNSGV